MMKISFILFILLIGNISFSQPIKGILQSSPANTNYFFDTSGKAIFLAGSHTWANFQEFGAEGQEKFDWQGYLDMMERHGHNFMRLWVWEQKWKAPWTDEDIFVEPMPYTRTNQGKALDGKGRFDLAKFNQAYFNRLRQRVEEAGERGIYVSIMMFQGFSLNKTGSEKGDPYVGHPFNKENNINGIGYENTNRDEDDKPTLHSMMSPDILKLQETYVEKVVETVNGLDNVLYEIINEGGSTDWQYHMISFIKGLEKKMQKKHFVGMTQRINPPMPNRMLDESPADWVSYANEWSGSGQFSDYKENPPENNSGKVSILDTDHIWGHGGNYKWAWKAFCRGHNPIFMDPWQHLPGKHNKETKWNFINGGISENTRDYPDWEPLRKNLGYICDLAGKMDLANMHPRSSLSSTGYCLSNPGKEYIIYFPEGGMATVDLTHSKTTFKVAWFIPIMNKWVDAPQVIEGGGYVKLTPPFTGDAVLWLRTEGF